MSGRKSSNSRTRGSRRSALNALSRRKDDERARANKKQYEPYDETNQGVDTRNHAREVGEMRKRRDIVEQTRTTYMPLAAAKPKKAVPFDKIKTQDQNVFVVHIISKGTRPCSTKPALRIMGAFRDIEDAIEYSEEYIDPHFKNWDKHAFVQGREYVMMHSHARQQNEAAIIEKIGLIKEAHNIVGTDAAQRNYRVWARQAMKGREGYDDDEDEEEDQRDEETRKKDKEDQLRREQFNEKSVFRKEQMATALANQKSARTQAIEANLKERCKVDAKVKTTSNRVPAECKIEGQNFAAISSLKDITPKVLKGEATAEPLVIIWGVFKTLEDAEKWAKKAQTSIIDYNIDIVDMYVLLPLQHVNTENIETKYRHEHQNDIMGSIDRGHQHVSDFEEYCEGQGLGIPTTEIEIQDHGKVVNVTRKNQGIANTMAQASEEIISKDLPTDSAKLRSDPLFVSKKDARKKLEEHKKIWDNIPAQEVTYEMAYGCKAHVDDKKGPEEAVPPSKADEAVSSVEVGIAKVRLADDAMIEDEETQ